MTLLGLPAYAGEAIFDYRQQSNGPLIEVDQWATVPIRENPAQQLAALKAQVRAEQALLGPVSGYFAKGIKAYYRGDANVLVAAATDKTKQALVVPENARTPFRGRMQQLRSTDIGLQAAFTLPADLSLTVRPYVSAIHKYERVDVNGSLQKAADSLALVGSLQRVGTRRYGFLVNELDDKGQAFGLDVGLAWQHGPWALQVQADNLIHHIRFSSVHYSNRRYNMATRNDKLVVREVGEYSLEGEYGLQRRSESLPVHTHWRLRHGDLPHWSAGIVSVGKQASPWLAYERQFGSLNVGVSTVELRNLSLDVGWEPVKGLQAGVGWTYAQASKPALGRLTIGYRW